MLETPIRVLLWSNRLTSGTKQSMMNRPPGSKWAATFWKHSIYRSWVSSPKDRVEREVDEREGSGDPHVREVSDRHRYGLSRFLTWGP